MFKHKWGEGNLNIHDIVIYCNDLYKNNHSEYRCENCENKCKGSCESCLDAIHFGDDRRYNCKNIVNYYFCKYIYKYSSEIKYLFEAHHTLIGLDNLRVLSIGCGPCTDLFGILTAIENSEDNKKLEYTGIDLNDTWVDIHDYILANKSDDFKVEFIYDDVFNIIHSDKFKKEINPNIIVFQYVLSDIIKYNNDIEIKDFLDKLINEIIIKLEDDSFIIFNDINHMDTRKYFDYMRNKISSQGINIQWKKHHFKHDIKPYYRYGTEHDSNNVAYDVPFEILGTYSPWTFCSSSQLVIRKKVLE